MQINCSSSSFKLNNLVTPNSKHPLNKLLIGWEVQLYSKYACMGLTQCLVVTRWASYRGIGHLVRLAAVLTAAHGKTPAASPGGGQAAVALLVAAQVTMVSVSAEAVPMEAPVPVVRADDP